MASSSTTTPNDAKWFRVRFLTGRETLPRRSGAATNIFVAQVCRKFGVKEEEVTHALAHKPPHDPLNVAYHLIIDNKVRVVKAKGELA